MANDNTLSPARRRQIARRLRTLAARQDQFFEELGELFEELQGADVSPEWSGAVFSARGTVRAAACKLRRHVTAMLAAPSQDAYEKGVWLRDLSRLATSAERAEARRALRSLGATEEEIEAAAKATA